MITHCTRADFDQIVTHIDEFWGDDRALPLHHPMFFYEFGDTAWVIRDGDLVAAYLFGFFAQTAPVAYAHLLAVRAGYRRRGLACGLYEHFIRLARERGCRELKGLILPTNEGSIRFHLARTVVRRAERVVARLFHAGEMENENVLHYLNRLSSLLFALARYEDMQAGVDRSTFARES